MKLEDLHVLQTDIFSGQSWLPVLLVSEVHNGFIWLHTDNVFLEILMVLGVSSPSQAVLCNITLWFDVLTLSVRACTGSCGFDIT